MQIIKLFHIWKNFSYCKMSIFQWQTSIFEHFLRDLKKCMGFATPRFKMSVFRKFHITPSFHVWKFGRWNLHCVMISECVFENSVEEILLVLQRSFSCHFGILKSIQQAEFSFSFVESWKISKILEKSSIFFFFLFPFIIGCKMFSERFWTINQPKCCHFAI